MITRVKGTQDFLDLSLFNYLIDVVKNQCKNYEYTEIATPLIEHTSLFVRSIGEHTDVVSKEMFLIKSHQENENPEDSMCLRPEATASMVRAFIENNVEQTPWKVFTWGPMFRYERPQKGRYRQFHQVSLEIIGAQSLSADAELLVMLDRMFHEHLKLVDYALTLNFLGCAEDRAAYKKKLYDWVTLKHKTEICDLCTIRVEKNIMRIFDCKQESCQKIYAQAPKIIDSLCAPCSAEWTELQQQLDLLSVTYIIEPRLVRGLDYYSKTVFEFVSGQLGAQSTFCGGGRYDQLVKQLGAREDQPSIGAGIGIERILLMLESIKDRLPLPAAPASRCIIPFDKQQETLALLLADELRANNIAVDILFDGSVKSRLKKANKRAASHVLLLGADEQNSRTVMVKNMVTGAQELIPQAELVAHFKR